MSKEARSKMYRDHLVTLGYVPEIVDGGHVRFKVEGSTYFINASDDQDYFRITYRWTIRIDSEADRAKALAAALEATGGTKVAKVYLIENDAVGSLEMFCSPPEAFKPSFPRSLKVLKYAVDQFNKHRAG